MIKYKVHVEDDGAIKWHNEEGFLHRLDGPAKEYVDGTKIWYKEGKLHRLDGPALEDADGDKRWYINGESFTEEGFNKQVNGCEGKVVEIVNKRVNGCEGKVVEIDGVKYRLTQV